MKYASIVIYLREIKESCEAIKSLNNINIKQNDLFEAVGILYICKIKYPYRNLFYI